MTDFTSDFLEKFILAENKQNVLKELTPRTNLFNFVELMIDFHTPSKTTEELEFKFQNFKQQKPSQNHLEIAHLKILLKKIEHAKNDSHKLKLIAKEINENFFHLKFNHKNLGQTEYRSDLQECNQSSLSSVLSEDQVKQMSLQFHLEEVYNTYSLLNVNPAFYTKLDLSKFNLKTNFEIIEKILLNHKNLSEIKGIKELVWEISKLKGNDYVLNNVWPLLTLEMKEELISSFSNLFNSKELIYVFIKQKFDLERIKQIDTENTLKIQILKEAIEFSNDLPLKYHQIKRGLSKLLLNAMNQQGVVEKTVLLNYIEDPYCLENDLMRDDFVKKKEKERQANKDEEFEIVDEVFDLNEENLINDCLRKLFKTESNFEEFETFLDPLDLKKYFWQVKMENGVVCEIANELFTDNELEMMYNKKELKFFEDNRRRFDKNDRVEIKLSIKNVSKLIVQVFEVNTFNFILEKNHQDFHTLDVAGLIPLVEYEYNYFQNPIVIHHEIFQFDSIQSCDFGVFVIDFIGGDVKSRSVIYKNQLNLLHDSIHGRKCTIRDRNGILCKGPETGLYIGKIFFEADLTTGEIFIPINIASLDEKVIVCYKEFADLCYLKIQDPNPEFSASIIYNSEEFLPGNKVTFVIRPNLFLYNSPASLSFISKFKVKVLAINYQNVTIQKIFSDLTLTDRKNLLIDFIFPPKIVSISIHVETEIKLGQQIINKEFVFPIEINRMLNNETFDILFQENEEETIYLYILGKNGEPRKSIMVNLEIILAHRNNPFQIQMITDANGCCILEKLENLVAIEASSGLSKSYFVGKRHLSKPSIYPNSIILSEYEQLHLPIDSENGHVLLHSIDKNDFIINRISRSFYSISNKQLNIQGLVEGLYQLLINDFHIKIKVVKEEFKTETGRLLWSKKDIFVREDKPRAWFISKKEKEDHFEFEIKSQSELSHLNIHLLTYNYLPNEILAFFEEINVLNSETRTKKSYSNFEIKTVENSFLIQSKLDNELVYIYDRKSQKPFLGNTLEKPGTILKRTKIGETKEKKFENDEICNADTNRHLGHKESKKRKAKKKRTDDDSGSIVSDDFELANFINRKIRINEFQANPGKLVPNLEISNNKIKIKKSEIDKYAYSFLYISEAKMATILPIQYSIQKSVLKDCSLQQSKTAGFIYDFSREVNYLKTNEKISIKNISSTEVFIISSLKELFECFRIFEINGSFNFQEWEFLCNWHLLSAMDKLKKYDKFYSHELNLFLFFKDNDFFDEVVRPLLQNKKEKEIIDHFLLENKLEFQNKFNFACSENLNVVEKILLAVSAKNSHPNFSNSMINLFQSTSLINKLSSEEFKIIFESIINSNSKNISKLKTSFDCKPQVKLIKKKQCEVQTIEEDGFRHDGDLDKQRCETVEDFEESQRDEDEDDDEFYGGGGEGEGGEKDKKECKKHRVEFANSCCDSKIYEEKKSIFEKSQGTIEFKEKQFFQDRFTITISEFWTDLLEYLINNNSNENFGSKHFLKKISSLFEFISILSFIDLPFKKNPYESAISNNILEIKANSNMFILSKEIISKEGERFDLEVSCSQKIFDPEDPFIYDNENPDLFFDKQVDEFIVNKVYGLRVVITNSSTTQLKLGYIIEIPSGSIPTDSLDSLHIKDITVDQFGSEVRVVKFYFPKPGEFDLFPASVVSNGRIVSSAKKLSKILVKAIKTPGVSKTIKDVLLSGNINDILEFIKSKNLLNEKVFTFNQIYWLLKNRVFYDNLLLICDEKGVYDNTVWSFGFYHGDYKRIQQFIQNKKNLSVLEKLKYHSSDICNIDTFCIREFYPLINPRAHVLGSQKTNIINSSFKKTYNDFLSYLFFKYHPKPEDFLILVNYLIAQDQIEKAIQVSAKLQQKEIVNHNLHIQYDYQKAYLGFITDYPDFKITKNICQKYLTYPVLSIRNLFVEVANQIAEFEEITFKENEKIIEIKTANDEKKTTVFSFSVFYEGVKIKIVSTKPQTFILKFYKIEVEVLFSLYPFEFESKKAFSNVSPFLEETVSAKDQIETTAIHFEIPKILQNENLFIEVKALNNKIQNSEFVSFIPFKLNCTISSEIGILKCSDFLNNKPVPKIYSKCYAKYKSGEVKFYKDGYTDLRGSFDYVSLNSDDIEKIDSFSILVSSPDFGSKHFVEKAPKIIGTLEGEAKNLISKDWEMKREKNIQSSQEKMYKSKVNQKYAHVIK